VPDTAPAVAAGGADITTALRASRPCMREFEAAALVAEAECDANDALEVSSACLPLLPPESNAAAGWPA
jgi:hypothetical protein